MKTMKLSGKDYVQVVERIKYFREHYKEGRIETEIYHLSDKVIFTARIFDGERLLSTGHGMKNTAKEFELEKAETRAIGRALGIAGIGIDAGIASYEEIADFHNQKTPEVNLMQSGKEAEWLTENTKNVLLALKDKHKITDSGFADRIEQYYNCSIDGLLEKEGLDLIKKITEKFGS